MDFSGAIIAVVVFALVMPLLLNSCLPESLRIEEKLIFINLYGAYIVLFPLAILNDFMRNTVDPFTYIYMAFPLIAGYMLRKNLKWLNADIATKQYNKVLAQELNKELSSEQIINARKRVTERMSAK